MPTKPKAPANKKATATKKEFAFSVQGDNAIGYERFASLEAVMKDGDLAAGEFDGHTIEVWQLVGTYEVVPGPRTLKEVK